MECLTISRLNNLIILLFYYVYCLNNLDSLLIILDLLTAISESYLQFSFIVS